MSTASARARASPRSRSCSRPAVSRYDRRGVRVVHTAWLIPICVSFPALLPVAGHDRGVRYVQGGCSGAAGAALAAAAGAIVRPGIRKGPRDRRLRRCGDAQPRACKSPTPAVHARALGHDLARSCRDDGFLSCCAAVDNARSTGTDVVLVDTAGRMQVCRVEMLAHYCIGLVVRNKCTNHVVLRCRGVLCVYLVVRTTHV